MIINLKIFLFIMLSFSSLVNGLEIEEKTLDVPLGITEPILGGYPNQATTKDKSTIKENL